jgi:hypothetical protein
MENSDDAHSDASFNVPEEHVKGQGYIGIEVKVKSQDKPQQNRNQASDKQDHIPDFPVGQRFKYFFRR